MIRISVGETTRLVEERTGAMIRWLMEHAERVQQVERGCVSFSVAGKSVEAELKEKSRVSSCELGVSR